MIFYDFVLQNAIHNDHMISPIPMFILSFIDGKKYSNLENGSENSHRNVTD